MATPDDSSREHIARRLRQARELAGLSQAQVSNLLGLHRPSISEIEAGRRRVSADELVKLARIYRVAVDWLTKGDDDTQNRISEDMRLAARELSAMESVDLDRLVKIIKMIKGRRED